MRTLLIAAVLLTAANFSSNTIRATRRHRDGDLRPPAGRVAAVTAAFGRPASAAAVMWLQAVHFIGAPERVAWGYKSLGPWLLRATELAPDLTAAHRIGAALLVAEPTETVHAATLLERAEAQLPPRCRTVAAHSCASSPALDGCDWEIPMWQGFVAYFGQLDAPTAAGHFCEAARRGGPVYLSSLAERLRGASQSCDSFRAMLTETLSDDALASSRDNLRAADLWRLSNRCETESLRQAAGAFRLARGKNPTDLDELLREGFLRAPPVAPPGQCWKLWGERGPELEPCAAGSP